MSNQTITRHAAFSAAAPAWKMFSRLHEVAHHWMVRRKVRNLAELDDRMLADIGVRRDEVIWASHLPLSVNAALELEAAAYRRRNRKQRQR